MGTIEEPQFWVIEYMDLAHREDAQRSLDRGDFVPLVDEAVGGIVAYVLRGNEDSILAHLGEKEV